MLTDNATRGAFGLGFRQRPRAFIARIENRSETGAPNSAVQAAAELTSAREGFIGGMPCIVTAKAAMDSAAKKVAARPRRVARIALIVGPDGICRLTVELSGAHADILASHFIFHASAPAIC